MSVFEYGREMQFALLKKLFKKEKSFIDPQYTLIGYINLMGYIN